MLNGTVENKTLVRSVFSSIVGTPAQTFGAAATSNMPRVRQSELLTPAELMVMLHDSEKDVGLKSAIEGELMSVLVSIMAHTIISYRRLFFDD
jgi:symplekin